MTLPFDGEYLRDPRFPSPPFYFAPKGAGDPTATDGLDAGLALQPATINAEPRTPPAEGLRTSGGSDGDLRAVHGDGTPLAPVDVSVSSDASRHAIGIYLLTGTASIEVETDAATSAMLRDMLDDAIGFVGGEQAQAELERLRRAVQAVRDAMELAERQGYGDVRFEDLHKALDGEA